MLDPKLLRENPDLIKEALSRRGSSIDLGVLEQLDRDYRSALQDAEELRSKQKEAGKEIATLEGDAKQAAIDEVSELAAAQKAASSKADELSDEFTSAWLDVPNLVDPTAADGLTEEDAVEIKRFGDPASEGASHAALGESLDIIDTERGAKVSGSRFGYLKGKGAMLELSLVRWAMDHLAAEGFTPMIPPVLVRERALEGTGFRSLRITPMKSSNSTICRLDTQDSRPAFVVRQALMERTPLESSVFTSSTKWRCSSSPTPRIRWPSTTACWLSKSLWSNSSISPIGL